MVTPAPQVEGDEDRYQMFCKGHVVVEVTYLCLNIIIARSVGIFFNIAAEIITINKSYNFLEMIKVQCEV